MSNQIISKSSFHTVFSALESMGKRLRNCIRGKIPKVDAVQDALSNVEPREVEAIFDSVVAKTYRNAVLRGGGIRDGCQKDEGERTGGKRLVRKLRESYGHFADVIVADALYLNARS